MNVFEVADKTAVADFFYSRLRLSPTKDFRGVLWIPNEYRGQLASMDHVAAAVGFHTFIGRVCCMHTVIQKPEFVTRKMIRDAFHYVFVVAGCEAVLGLVDTENKSAIEFDTRLGFKEVYRIKEGGLDGDLIVYEMKRMDCRWLSKEVKHGWQVGA